MTTMRITVTMMVKWRWRWWRLPRRREHKAQVGRRRWWSWWWGTDTHRAAAGDSGRGDSDTTVIKHCVASCIGCFAQDSGLYWFAQDSGLYCLLFTVSIKGEKSSVWCDTFLQGLTRKSRAYKTQNDSQTTADQRRVTYLHHKQEPRRFACIETQVALHI